MARTKDITRHADLAANQVAEALELVWNELSSKQAELERVTLEVEDLNSRFARLRDAALALNIDISNLT